MRSSNKNRSRNKNGRKSIGNIINRVFESNGPEGKVRGTPQQIIEKYTMLSRDAATSGDRVAAENFMQHAEHYIRLLAEAQRELGIRQEPGQHQSSQPQPAYAIYAEPARDDSPLGAMDDDDQPEAGLVLTPEGHDVLVAPRPAPMPVHAPQPVLPPVQFVAPVVAPVAVQAPIGMPAFLTDPLPAPPRAGAAEPAEAPAEEAPRAPGPRSRSRRRPRPFGPKAGEAGGDPAPVEPGNPEG